MENLTKARRVLFLGNSITYHPAVPDDGFMINGGMAASSVDKDYVHLLIKKITEVDGVEPETIIENIADFERQHATMDLAAFFKKHIEFNADMLILAIGENVPVLETEEMKAAYYKGFVAMMRLFKQNNNLDIIVRGCFWPDETKDDIMKRASEEVGATFISASHLASDESNFARSERKFNHDGIAGHPGDKGMAGLADILWGVVKERI